MFGLPEKTIVIGCEEAKEYIKSKILVLEAERESLEEQVDKLYSQIDLINEKIAREQFNLYNVSNPPTTETTECKCCYVPEPFIDNGVHVADMHTGIGKNGKGLITFTEVGGKRPIELFDPMYE